jgi:hypothetical protein
MNARAMPTQTPQRCRGRGLNVMALDPAAGRRQLNSAAVALDAQGDQQLASAQLTWGRATRQMGS